MSDQVACIDDSMRERIRVLIENANAGTAAMARAFQRAADALGEFGKAAGLLSVEIDRHEVFRRQAIAKARGRNWRNAR